MHPDVLKAVIVDDEILARRRIANLLEKDNEIEVIKECKNGREAIAQIDQIQPDIVFLDIQIKDMDGFEVLKKIKAKPLIIFVTAHHEFAVKAFDFFAFDYLLKPYKDERFFSSVKKAISIKKEERGSDFEKKLSSLTNFFKNPELMARKFSNQKLTIKTGNRISFVDKSTIKYIKASGYYAEIFTDQKKYLIRDSLSNLVGQLNPIEFIRIHRSTIINISFMNEIKQSGYGEIDVKMNDEALFRVSKSYRKEFQKFIGLRK